MFSNSNTYLRLGFLAGMLFWALAGCSHKEVNPEDPESLFQDAEESLTDEKYLIALEKFRDIKNRFPYSSRAADAELKIADTYFEQESYLEAESAYEIFRELHPTHPKADYVQYRIGLSYFKLIPDNPARDLSAAYRAIDAFHTLMNKFPESSFVELAKAQIEDARKKLAENESYVADFYFQKKHYLSASYRYASLLQEFSNLGYEEEALYRLGESYFHIRMNRNSQDAFRRLVKAFPDSSYRSAAESRLSDLVKAD